jgi:hypothetical protein
MTLQDFISHLENHPFPQFVLPSGHVVPKHFHITEVGTTVRNYIDCGGKIRTEKNINFQLWVANDLHHSLSSNKIKQILDLSQSIIDSNYLEVEVEWQQESIARYGLKPHQNGFELIALHTQCKAEDHCGIPEEQMVYQSESNVNFRVKECKPNTGCC